jgi:threonine dehydrogenase-like Zn-dependent dehydrogenase
LNDGTMTAVRLRKGVPDIVVETVPVPEPGSGEVRIRVEFSGVCLTDLHFIDGERHSSMADEVTLGHEVSGVIDALGADVTGWRVGDRVTANPTASRPGGDYILGVHHDGGWADYVTVPEDTLVDIGDLDFEMATIIPDAVSTPWGAVAGAARVLPGEAAAVWGLGGLGYHAIRLLRLVGAHPIVAVDPLPAARERATSAGADIALDPGDEDFLSKVRAGTNGRGPDVAFDFFGHPSIHQQAFDALGVGGRMVLVGLPPSGFELRSTADLIRQAKSVIGSHGSDNKQIQQIVEFARSGRLDLSTSITRIYPLSEARSALDSLRSKDDNPIRMLLRPGV